MMSAAAASSPASRSQGYCAAASRVPVSPLQIAPQEAHLPPEVESLAWFTDGPVPGLESEQPDAPKGLLASLAGLWRYQGP